MNEIKELEFMQEVDKYVEKHYEDKGFRPDKVNYLDKKDEFEVVFLFDDFIVKGHAHLSYEYEWQFSYEATTKTAEHWDGLEIDEKLMPHLKKYQKKLVGYMQKIEKINQEYYEKLKRVKAKGIKFYQYGERTQACLDKEAGK
jgi:hypothetical protein